MHASDRDDAKSRGAKIEAAGFTVPMPDADHPIIGTVAEIGWCEVGGMGAAPLSSGEIMAWCDGMGERLTPWEFSMVRRMSEAFCAGLRAERAPYQPTLVRMALASAAFAEG